MVEYQEPEEGEESLEKSDESGQPTVQSYLELQRRIKAWSDGFFAGHPVAVNNGTRSRHWYYSPAYDTFGPSKFVGYANISLDSYLGTRNIAGTETEAAIKALREHEILKDKEAGHGEYAERLAAMLALQDKRPNSVAKVHVPKSTPIRDLMTRLNWSERVQKEHVALIRDLLTASDGAGGAGQTGVPSNTTQQSLISDLNAISGSDVIVVENGVARFDDEILESLEEDRAEFELFLADRPERRRTPTKVVDTHETRHGGAPMPSKEPARPVNLILYGPPGTGKTYKTAEHAVALCDTGRLSPDDAAPKREEVMRRYRSLCDDGRIAFATFHQSYGYEEFVEGIRPVLGGDEGDARSNDVSYEIRPGVFKKMCEIAGQPSASEEKTGEIAADAQNVWKMSLGEASRESWVFTYCIDNDCLLLGYGYGLDFSGCDTKDAIAERHRRQLEGKEWKPFSIDAVDRFKNQMRRGDIVIVSDGNLKIRAIGRIAGDYEFLADQEYGQVRKVEWLRTLERSVPREAILKKSISQQTIYKFKSDDVKLDALNALLAPQEPVHSDHYVLIIDEINRGNISKIFGELITLLEPDKRLGQPNELRVTLPCSGETFAVPPNLHVIGTMNTADRSIALLDAALRRRFQFAEMMPDVALVEAMVGVVDGVDVARLLESMNARIRFLYDRDHQIGHSYFLGVKSLEDLRRVFVDGVIPLLQEYFYGAWDKVCAVLGCPYDEKGRPAIKDARGEKIAGYAAPMVTAEWLGETTTLGYDHPDYEDDKVDYRVSERFCKPNPVGLRDYFASVAQPLANPPAP